MLRARNPKKFNINELMMFFMNKLTVNKTIAPSQAICYHGCVSVKNAYRLFCIMFFYFTFVRAFAQALEQTTGQKLSL